jgi:ATP synthase protein I
MAAAFGGVFLYEGVHVLADDRQKGTDELDRRIASARASQSRGVSDAEGRSESRGWAIGIEFVGAVLVSGFIGWSIDRYMGCAPWAMIVFLLLGFAAGTRRAMKTSAQFDADPKNDI